MLQTETILYIEDDPASRKLVQRILHSKGYNVLVADDGLEGITLAREKKPRLILMDINLPSMDGREITTRLRSLPNFANIPIVALTANHSPGSRELALAAGCTGFMTKPIDVGTFPQQIDNFLNGHIEPLTVDQRSENLEIHAQNLVIRLENKISELEKANKRLRELDSLKSDFIILVSHELRTPLTLISGYAHLLNQQMKGQQETVSKEMVTGVAEGLNLGVNRMHEVVDEIISVSHITSGSLELALEPVKLNQFAEAIAQDLAQICEVRQLSLHVGDLSRLPVIQADRKQLRRALEQVISNAIKYTPDGGSIYLIGREVDGAIDIIVQDTGIGIPTQEHGAIFDQFHVLESLEHHSTNKYAFRGGGLGLGLAIARGIIEAHNGRIWVESDYRDLEKLPGSTFHILLPLGQSQQKLRR